MKGFNLLLGLTIIHAVLCTAVLERRACNADNCARAVTGTNAKPAMSIRQTDCSNFMTRTVTPDAITTTVTVNANAKARRDITLAARQNAAATPTYASACSGTSRYSSACSCWGFTASTATAPVPTSTVTVTAAATTTTTTTTTTTRTKPNLPAATCAPDSGWSSGSCPPGQDCIIEPECYSVESYEQCVEACGPGCARRAFDQGAYICYLYYSCVCTST